MTVLGHSFVIAIAAKIRFAFVSVFSSKVNIFSVFMKTTSNRVKLCRGAECLKNRFFICYFPVIFTYVWWVSHVYLFYAVFFTPRLANGTINYSDWITLVCYPSYGIVSMLCLVSLTRCVFTPPGVVDYGFDEMITETVSGV